MYLPAWVYLELVDYLSVNFGLLNIKLLVAGLDTSCFAFDCVLVWTDGFNWKIMPWTKSDS